jgi:hypothetical protein
MVVARVVGRMVAAPGMFELVQAVVTLAGPAGEEPQRIRVVGEHVRKLRAWGAGADVVVDGRWSVRGTLLLASSVRRVDRKD